MSKIKKSELLDIVREQGSAITNLLQRVTLLEKPQLKQIDQSVFNGLDSKWEFAAVDAVGTLKAFTYEPKLSVTRTGFILLIGSTLDIGTGYDASNWRNSLIKRESKSQLKQLDQSVFNGLEGMWLYAATDKNGSTWVFSHKPNKDSNYWYVDKPVDKPVGREIGEGYDTTNWQTSLIKRETNVLTGNELCKAMLARGDTRIMCLVTDDGSRDDITHVIRVYEDGRFHTKANSWKYAVPINNQGEPLTASEVGL